MGEIAAALKAVKGMQAAAHGAGLGSADTSDPGVQLMSDPLGGAPQMQANPLSTLYPNMPDFSGQGSQMAQADVPAMNAPQTQDAPQAPQMTAPVDSQPYDDNTYSTPEQIASSIGKGSDDEDISVKGDGWKPKKESGLGRIVDTLLELRGRRPVFKDRTDDKNLENAMKDAQDDENPGHINQQKVINRIRKFNGDLADKMQNTFDTQSRQNRNQDRMTGLYDMKHEEFVRDRIAGMFGALKPGNDPAGMKKLRDLAISKGKKEGFDFTEELPEDISATDWNAFRLGQVPVKDQMKIEQTDQKIKQGDRRLDQRDTSISNQDRHNKTMEGQGATKITDSEHARNSKLAQKYGLPVDPAEGFAHMSKDGKKGVKYHNGRWMKFERGEDGNLHPIGYID